MTHSGAFSIRRTPDEVFDLLSNPERFAPLMPDFESMAMQDASHFTMRTVIAIGEIKGHADLFMELLEASRPTRVEYRGSATIAGSQLRLAIWFQISSLADATEVNWGGQVALEGMLALMAGELVEGMGRHNFDRMAGNLRRSLQDEPLAPAEERIAAPHPSELDFDI